MEQRSERFHAYCRWFAGNLLAAGRSKGLRSLFVLVGVTGFESVASAV
jgi:hypothetical protein